MVEGGFPFPMLSDPGGAIGLEYGVYSDSAGVDLRAWFLIDPDGLLQLVEIASSGVGRNPDELLRLLRAYQEHRRTGDAVPSGWRPGDPTLEVQPSLVGHVWERWKVMKGDSPYS